MFVEADCGGTTVVSARFRTASLRISALTGAAILLGCVWQAAAAQQSEQSEQKSPGWQEVPAVNPSLPPAPEEINRATPQATVENFVLSARDDDFERAAYSLNLRLMEDPSLERAAELARQLYYVLNQELWVDWEALPDRADGMTDGSIFGSSPVAGMPRRNIAIGEIDLDGRSIPIRVQRVKADGEDPLWLISAQTVENVPRLYDAYGPGWLDRNLPEWAKVRAAGRVPIWEWVAFALLCVLAIIAAVLSWWLIGKWAEKSPLEWAGDLARRARMSLAVFVASLCLYLGKHTALTMTGPVSSFLDPLLLVLVIVAISWLVSSLIGFLAEYIAERAVRARADEGTEERRKLMTQLSVTRRVLLAIITITAIGVILVELDLFESLGLALITSAGAGTIILGLAGQSVLGNLLAGVQIAITRPFRVGDSVYIEDNWGRIEDVTYTYVTVRTWDHRRLVVPVRYFLDHYIENWSKTNRFMIKPIYLHVDYRADVEQIRQKFFELLRADDDWRETKDSYVGVTDTNSEGMVVRCTCGADDPSTAWYLHLRIREKLIAWLQQVDDGRWLPRQRVRSESPEHASAARRDWD